MATNKIGRQTNHGQNFKRVEMEEFLGKEPVIKAVMMPKDSNHLGSIFGGVILSYIDLAAGEHARSVSPKRYLTKVMREVNFIAPVYIGDSVSFYGETIRIGSTSICVRIDVVATRGINKLERIKVTSAEIVMVAVDNNNRPVPIN
jgi:acyl-CoA thioesterase YciA